MIALLLSVLVTVAVLLLPFTLVLTPQQRLILLEIGVIGTVSHEGVLFGLLPCGCGESQSLKSRANRRHCRLLSCYRRCYQHAA